MLRSCIQHNVSIAIKSHFRLILDSDQSTYILFLCVSTSSKYRLPSSPVARLAYFVFPIDNALSSSTMGRKSAAVTITTKHIHTLWLWMENEPRQLWQKERPSESIETYLQQTLQMIEKSMRKTRKTLCPKWRRFNWNQCNDKNLSIRFDIIQLLDSNDMAKTSGKIESNRVEAIFAKAEPKKAYDVLPLSNRLLFSH